MDREKETQLVALLEELEWPVSGAVFDALLPKVVSTAIELAVFDSEGRVLLAPRAQADKFWPGQYHMPGTVVRPNERFEEAMDRLLKGEVGQLGLSGRPQFLTYFFFPKGAGTDQCLRGAETGLLYVVRASNPWGYKASGKFFHLSFRPEPIIGFHGIMLDYLSSVPLPV